MAIILLAKTANCSHPGSWTDAEKAYRPLMEISFILLTWNSERYIESCIESIIAEGRRLGDAFEIYIVDNGSKDTTPAKIRRIARLHSRQHSSPFFSYVNLGTTRSRNAALKKAGGRYIVIMDSDIQLLPGVINGLRKTLQDDASVGLVAPRLIYPDNRLPEIRGYFSHDFPQSKTLYMAQKD